MDSLKNRGSGTGPFKFVGVGARRPHDARAQHGLLGPGRALGRPGRSSRSSATRTPWWPPSSPGSATSSSRCRRRTPRGSRSEFTMVRGTPGALTYEIRVNGTKPPFDKKEARHALHFAIDRQGVVNNVLFGVSEPTVLPFSRNSPAYDRSVAREVPLRPQAREGALREGRRRRRQGRVPDPAAVPRAARDLPGAEGRPREDRLHAGHRRSSTRRSTTSGCWPATSRSARRSPGTRRSTRRGWRSTASTARRTTRSGATRCPKAYLDALNEANGTIDPAKQKAAFAKFNAAILDEAWVISIAYRQSVFGLAKHVDGFAYTVDDMAVLENVSVEK